MQAATAASIETMTAEWLPAIERALDEATRLGEGSPPRLTEAMRYAALSPGKRLRPLLVVLAHRACGGDGWAAIPAAVAIELIHAYSLVHDDLPAMDDDDLRRGRPTCHIRYDEATAILVGDALQALAFATLAGRLEPAETARAAVALLATAAGATRLVGGQADDLAAEDRPVTMEELQSIHSRKTAALFAAAAELGGLVAQADAHRRGALRDYGRCLGLAFQISDDLLDLDGDAKQVGKRTGKDRQRGKSTHPLLAGVEASRQAVGDWVAAAVTALQPFGLRAAPLQQLAERIVGRNR